MNLKLTNYLLTGDYSKVFLFISRNTNSEEEAKEVILKGLNEAKAFGINSERIKKDILREYPNKDISDDREFSEEVAKRIYEKRESGGCGIIFLILFFITLFIFII